MNTVYVGINHRHHVISSALLKNALFECSTSFFQYGPGHVSQNTLEAGIEAFCQKNDVDFIITEIEYLNQATPERLNNYFTRQVYIYNEYKEIENFLTDFHGFCKSHPQMIVCSMISMDGGPCLPDGFDDIQSLAKYYMSFGHGIIDGMQEPWLLEKEHWYHSRLKNGAQNGVIEAFCAEVSDRTISIGHMVGDNEFHFSNISARKQLVTVPGAPYYRRELARKALKKRGLYAEARDIWDYLFKGMSVGGINPRKYSECLDVYNGKYRKLLLESAICVAEGAADNQILRKFFEGHCYGCLMLCWPPSGYEKIGYKEDIHFIKLSDANDIPDLVEDVEKNIIKFAKIAMAGQSLTKKLHSVSARAKQIGICLTAIKSDDFHGSTWNDGRFVLRQ